MTTSKIRAIIIDDEGRARSVLAKMLEEYCPNIELLEACENVLQAVAVIKQTKPDVVFLDIEMPDYSGFELLSFFKDKITFEIIFVTAYNQYALKAFEVSAIDYLLKPLKIDQLEKAVAKLQEKLHHDKIKERLVTLQANLASNTLQKIALPVAEGLVFVKVGTITHIDADGSYSLLHFKGEKNILISKKLKYFTDLLSSHKNFYRVHRSHLVNLFFVNKYDRHESLVHLENGSTIKVAKDNKVALEEQLRIISKNH